MQVTCSGFRSTGFDQWLGVIGYGYVFIGGASYHLIEAFLICTWLKPSSSLVCEQKLIQIVVKKLLVLKSHRTYSCVLKLRLLSQVSRSNTPR